jgi:hypothetical protein
LTSSGTLGDLARNDLGAALAAEDQVFGLGAEHPDLRLIPQREDAVVFEQYRAFRDVAVSGGVRERPVEVQVAAAVEGGGDHDDVEHAADRFIDGFHLERAGLDRVIERVDAHRVGLFEVVAAVERFDLVVHRAPVGGDGASNPHSPLRTSWSSQGFCAQGLPLMELYALMTVMPLPSVTQALNPGR